MMDQEEIKIATIYTTFCIILNIENTNSYSFSKHLNQIKFFAL